MILLDSSAWVEFFLSTELSKKVAEAIKIEKACTSIVTFTEVVNWCHKNNKQLLVEQYVEAIKKGSEVIDVNERIIIAAGRINFDRKKEIKKWGMMDSIILATARMYNLRILTKDQDFKDLPDAEML